jgi:hypothetical protein
MLSEEQLVQNYEKYSSLLLQSGEQRSSELGDLLNHLGDRLVLCPASIKKSHHSCFPGGLIDHSLRVLKNCSRLMKVAPDLYGDVPEQSVVFTALLHDLGKVGDLTHDRYIPQTNDYYAKRGNLYEINHEMVASTVGHASIFMLQHFKIMMSYDEFQSIIIGDDLQNSEENNIYKMRETSLTLLIQQSNRISCEQEKLISHKSK